MPSSLNADNGVASGTAGLKSSADNSGVLDLQTNGTTAISISASQVVTFANQPAYTGGTANGVLYLNASKVLTSGTALVFDATNTALSVGGAATNTAANRGNISINGTSNAILSLSTGASAKGYVYHSGSDMIVNATTGTLGLQANGKGALIDASGRIGFGTQGTSSDRLIDASFQGATTSGVNQFGLVLNPTYPTTPTSTIFNMYTGPNLTGGTTVTTVYGHYLEAINATGSTVTNRYGIYQAGASDNNVFAGNVAVNNGVTFPATQVASANANTLDDYEEGSWTPSLTFNDSTAGITYAVRTGRYVKVGRLVTLQGYISLTSKGSATGTGRMSGLPFAPENTAGVYTSCTTFWLSVVPTSGQLVNQAEPGSAALGLYYFDGGNANRYTTVTDAAINNNSTLYVCLSYNV